MSVLRWKQLLTFAAAGLFATSGTLHFTQTAAFAKIVPPWLPAPRLLVYLSGVAELAGATGLVIPMFRRPAAWGLTALLIAVFAANLYMATAHIQVTAKPTPDWALWARLPLQAILIWWVLWSTNRAQPPEATVSGM